MAKAGRGILRFAAAVGVLALTALSASCGLSKAQIDHTLSGGIIWPGPPESPRVRYLWSLQRVSGGGAKGGALRLLAGGGEEAEDGSTDFLVKPHGVFVDDRDILYVADTGAFRVNVIDLNSLKSFSIESAGGFPLVSPIGVVADRQGRIYVSDSELKRVAVFEGKGKFVSFFEGEFKRPTGLAINPESELIYVSDTWEHMVYIYNIKGKRLGSIGQRGEGPGKLNYPTHIAVDRDGFVFVSDTLNFRVQVFTPSGKLYTAFGLIGDSYDTFDKIKGISVDSEGHIYIVDSAQDMVKIYDRDGNMLLFFGQKGRFYGDFYLPTGMYIDSRDRIYVSDSLNMRVQAFQFLGGGD